ncbi:MAG TPA: glycosyltransferase [Terriglobia bacterium]|nr:glycosyltransferase [Terriglobia bacterium]
MYNEEESLPQLFERLATLQSENPRDWRLDFVLVNDGSSDRTMEVASRLKPAKWHVQILSHSVTRALARPSERALPLCPARLWFATIPSAGTPVNCYGGEMEPHTSAMEPRTSH